MRTRLAALVAAVLAIAVPASAIAHGDVAPAPTFPGVLLEWRLEALVLIGLLAWSVLRSKAPAKSMTA